MSLKIDYGSEIVEHLPLSQENILPEEYAKIAPLLDEGTDLIYPLRKYIFIAILFVLMNQSWVDSFIMRVFPSLSHFSYLVVALKGLLFATIIYLVDHLNLIQNK
jgi:hypothetical protein